MSSGAGSPAAQRWINSPKAVALVGLGVANTACARALHAHGHTVVLCDDGDSSGGERLAAELGCAFVHRPRRPELLELLGDCVAVLPTPGLPEAHPAFGVAAELDLELLSEFDLAAAWDDRPLLAVTGTNGKTTVCTLTAAMLEESGISCAAVGNLDVPLVAAIEDPGPSCFVVEASSFRLARSTRFAPGVATWLNFAADHLDVHSDLESYREAKARIWSHQGPGDVAVYNADDPVVSDAVLGVPEGVEAIGFTLSQGTGAPGVPMYRETNGVILDPSGAELLEVERLWSRLPHDRRNVMASAATALAGGASPDGVCRAALAFRGLPHRVELVASHDAVRFYNDSKATTPHATLAALKGFDSVVLIAGGRNKGVDLSVLGTAGNVAAAVGIGEAGAEVASAFRERPTVLATDMDDAVRRAASLASPGDTVLLSPGCASFDAYGSYAERGEAFRAAVERLGGTGAADSPDGTSGDVHG